MLAGRVRRRAAGERIQGEWSPDPTQEAERPSASLPQCARSRDAAVSDRLRSARAAPREALIGLKGSRTGSDLLSEGTGTPVRTDAPSLPSTCPRSEGVDVAWKRP